jgi:hypothetical protein
MLWNGWLQICCVSGWSPILDECHPFLVDLHHAKESVLQTCLLSWMIIHLGCIPPSILVSINHVMEWMLQICFLSQWSSNLDAYHPFLKDINHLWNGAENMLCILDDNSLLMKFHLFFWVDINIFYEIGNELREVQNSTW